jgi:hypothetical protein
MRRWVRIGSPAGQHGHNKPAIEFGAGLVLVELIERQKSAVLHRLEFSRRVCQLVVSQTAASRRERRLRDALLMESPPSAPGFR